MEQLPVGKMELTITDNSTIYSPFYRNNKAVISDELAEFITNSASEFKFNQSLELNIHCQEMNEAEKEEFKEAIKNYYTQNNIELNNELKSKSLRSLIFFIVGFIALGFMIVLGNILEREIWVDVLDVFSCIFIWTSVDTYFIERFDIKSAYKKNLQLIDMNINIIDDHKE